MEEDWQADLGRWLAPFPEGLGNKGHHLDRHAPGALVRTRIGRAPAKAPAYGMALPTSARVANGVLTVNLRVNGDCYWPERGIDILDRPAVWMPDAVRAIAYAEKGRSAELGLDWLRASVMRRACAMRRQRSLLATRRALISRKAVISTACPD